MVFKAEEIRIEGKLNPPGLRIVLICALVFSSLEQCFANSNLIFKNLLIYRFEREWLIVAFVSSCLNNFAVWPSESAVKSAYSIIAPPWSAEVDSLRLWECAARSYACCVVVCIRRVQQSKHLHFVTDEWSVKVYQRPNASKMQAEEARKDSAVTCCCRKRF